MNYVYSGHEGFHEAVADRLASAGFTRVTKMSQADTVLTFCLSQTQLEDVYFDEQGFVQSARPNTLLVDLSASSPSFARELNAVAVVSDLVFVEAPLVVEDITCPDAFADYSNLSCFVAGEANDIVRAKTLLDAIVGSVHETGGSGSAQLARAARTLQIMAQVVAAIEANALYHTTMKSQAGTHFSQTCVGAATPQAESILANITKKKFSGAFTVEMFLAELSAALMAADDVDLILPQAEAAMNLLELLAVIGGADKSPSALALVYGEEVDCAEQGLDWTRVEHDYRDEDEGFDFDENDNSGHDHEDFRGFDYSAN